MKWNYNFGYIYFIRKNIFLHNIVMSGLVVEATTPNVFTAYIKIYELNLFIGLKSKVLIYNEDNELISTENVVIEGDDYNSWSDDFALQDLILSKCNLRKKQSPTGSTGPTGETGPTGPADPVSE